MIPWWKEETSTIILAKNHQKISICKEVTSILVGAVGQVTILTNTSDGTRNYISQNVLNFTRHLMLFHRATMS